MHRVLTMLAYGYRSYLFQIPLPQNDDKHMRKTRSEDGADRTSRVRAAREALVPELPY